MALEPAAFFENVSTSDSFTNINAADNFAQNSPNADELEHPARSAGIAIAYAASGTGSGSITEARTAIPSLREPVDLYVGDVHDDVDPASWPFPHLDLRGNVLNPGANERMLVEVQGGDGGAAEDYHVVFMLSDGAQRSIPSGPVRRVFFTGDSATGTAGAWNRVGISLDQTLQNGDYEVIGGSVRDSGATVFGFDFEDRTGVYGGFTVDGEHDTIPPFQQPGGLNSGWGRFRDEAPPDLLVFAETSGNTPEGHIDIVGPLNSGQ